MQYEQIFKQKESLILWKNYLLSYLSTPNFFNREEMYLIKQDYFDNFTKDILNQDIMDDKELKKKWKNSLDIQKDIESLNKKLNGSIKNLNDLPKIFPLNKNNYQLFKNIIPNKDNNSKEDNKYKYIGIINENLLEIKINKLLYLFYFMYNENLRQGFLKAKDGNLLDQIMFDIEQSSPNFFIKDKTGKNLDDKEVIINEHNFNLYIIGKIDFNIKKIKDELNEFNQEKSSRLMSQSMVTPISKKEIDEYYIQVKKNSIKDNMKLRFFSFKKRISDAFKGNKRNKQHEQQQTLFESNWSDGRNSFILIDNAKDINNNIKNNNTINNNVKNNKIINIDDNINNKNDYNYNNNIFNMNQNNNINNNIDNNQKNINIIKNSFKKNNNQENNEQYLSSVKINTNNNNFNNGLYYKDNNNINNPINNNNYNNNNYYNNNNNYNSANFNNNNNNYNNYNNNNNNYNNNNNINYNNSNNYNNNNYYNNNYNNNDNNNYNNNNNNNYNNNNNNNYNNNYNDINYNDNKNNSNNNNDLNPAVTMRSSTLFELEDSINGLIGLANIGATCYMNATLQCFSNIELLRTEFLDPSIYDNLDKNKETKTILSFALAEVFRNLWIKFDETKKYYAPENFKKIISEKNPLFRGIQANDPKDLILFMFETMHSELKTTDLNVVYDSNWVPNEHILEEVYKDFSNYYLSKNKSIIFDIFYGCTNIVTSCINCKSELHNVQVSNILFFPLEEVRKFKKYNNETPVTINDCFEYNQRCDVYESYYCNVCNNNNSTAISFTRFLYTPRVLVINLNRGKGIQFNVKINFDEFIDIKNFVVAKESPYKYELTGVICHFGESGMGGHFIAFCKHFTYQGSKWYKFNDAFVEECTFDDVKTKGMPYVLFYSYIDIAEN